MMVVAFVYETLNIGSSQKWDSDIWLRVLRDSGQWVMCTAKYRPVLSSERAPYMKKQVHVRLKNM
jgi:hypothetical protein